MKIRHVRQCAYWTKRVNGARNDANDSSSTDRRRRLDFCAIAPKGSNLFRRAIPQGGYLTISVGNNAFKKATTEEAIRRSA